MEMLYQLNNRESAKTSRFLLGLIALGIVFFFAACDNPTEGNCTATFNAGGGTPAPEPQKVTPGGKIPSPAAMTKEGFTFEGWYAAGDFSGSPWNFAVDTVTGDSTLYAKWTPMVYIVTYNLNGGTNHGDNPANYTIESSDLTLENPAKMDAAFGGWYTDQALTTAAPNPAIPAGSAGHKTFYAKWLQGAAGITFITYWVDAQGNLSLKSGDSVITALSLSQTGSLSITAAGGGYGDQHWYINGVEDTVSTNQSSYTFSGAGKDIRTYSLGLRAAKNGGYYYTTVTITVTK
jgi:uncharacterized repeat protein (TIGR02543 family)